MAAGQVQSGSVSGCSSLGGREGGGGVGWGGGLCAFVCFVFLWFFNGVGVVLWERGGGQFVILFFLFLLWFWLMLLC